MERKQIMPDKGPYEIPKKKKMPLWFSSWVFWTIIAGAVYTAIVLLNKYDLCIGFSDLLHNICGR